MQSGLYPDVPPDFGHWLAGFIDGEGCFSIEAGGQQAGWTNWYPRLQVRVRDDDLATLLTIEKVTGVGRVRSFNPPSAYRSKPQATWSVFSRPGCSRTVEIFDAYPLRAKKARDFAIWREAVAVWLTIRRTGHRSGAMRNMAAWESLGELREQLMAVRAYRSPHLPAQPEVRQMDAIARADQLFPREGVPAAEMS